VSTETEAEMLIRLCVGLGSTKDQARAMAVQLMKRAEQLKIERGSSREDAMRYLLEVLTKGRAGEVATEYDKARPPISSDSTPKTDV